MMLKNHFSTARSAIRDAFKSALYLVSRIFSFLFLSRLSRAALNVSRLIMAGHCIGIHSLLSRGISVILLAATFLRYVLSA